MGRWIGKTVGSGGGREGLGLVVVVVGGGVMVAEVVWWRQWEMISHSLSIYLFVFSSRAKNGCRRVC